MPWLLVSSTNHLSLDLLGPKACHGTHHRMPAHLLYFYAQPVRLVRNLNVQTPVKPRAGRPLCQGSSVRTLDATPLTMGPAVHAT